jgi:hypothetical protein
MFSEKRVTSINFYIRRTFLVLRRREVVRAVILAGTNSSNLLELLDHKGVPSVFLGNNALGVPPDFKNRDVIFPTTSKGRKA